MTCSVLIFEDDEDVAQVETLLLTQEGCTVTRAVTPEQREAVFSRSLKPYDAVIVDLMMAPPTGYELIAYAKKLHPDIRVIISTAIPVTPEIEALGDVVLRKPYRLQKLMEALHGKGTHD